MRKRARNRPYREAQRHRNEPHRERHEIGLGDVAQPERVGDREGDDGGERICDGKRGSGSEAYTTQIAPPTHDGTDRKSSRRQRHVVRDQDVGEDRRTGGRRRRAYDALPIPRDARDTDDCIVRRAEF